MTLWYQFCGESVPDGLHELSHGPFAWAVDNQSFVNGSNYFFVLIRFNSIRMGWESCSSVFFYIQCIVYYKVLAIILIRMAWCNFRYFVCAIC